MEKSVRGMWFVLGLDSDAGELGTALRKKENFSLPGRKRERPIRQNVLFGGWGRIVSRKEAMEDSSSASV